MKAHEIIKLAKSRNRKQAVIRIRRAVIQILRKDGYSLESIAAYLGLDHTTVLYHLQQGAYSLANEEHYRVAYNIVKANEIAIKADFFDETHMSLV